MSDKPPVEGSETRDPRDSTRLAPSVKSTANAARGRGRVRTRAVAIVGAMFVATGLATGAGLVLTGCGSPEASAFLNALWAPQSNEATATGEDPLRVVATTAQTADFVRVIGGDLLVRDSGDQGDATGAREDATGGGLILTSLQAVGASAHDNDLAPAQLVALAQADVVVRNGAGLDPALDDALEAAGFKGEVIDASEGVDLEQAAQITAETGDHEGDESPTAAMEHAHDHDDEHPGDVTNTEVDPHLWTSPRFAADMVREISAELQQARPALAAELEANTEEYVQQLAALDGWASEVFASVDERDRVLVSSHQSLRYYLHDYDIDFAGAIVPGVSDNAEPTAAGLEELETRIGETGARAVFIESTVNPALASRVARNTGATLVETPLYAEGFGLATSGAETYLDATVHNTRVIAEAWGATVPSFDGTNQEAAK